MSSTPDPVGSSIAESRNRRFRLLLLRSIKTPAIVWLLILGMREGCAQGHSLDDYDYTVMNRSGEDVIVTPVSPPDENGNYRVVWRRPFKERRFYISDGATDDINLETGDFDLGGWVIEGANHNPKFLERYDVDFEIEIPELDRIPDATAQQIEPHLFNLRSAARGAAWIVGPILLMSCLSLVSLLLQERRAQGGSNTWR